MEWRRGNLAIQDDFAAEGGCCASSRIATSDTSLIVAEEFPWWSATHPPPGIEGRIGLVLHEVKSWSESMRLWGDEDGDNAYVCYKGDSLDQIAEIGFRLDVRYLNRSLLQAICMLANEIDCVLMTAEYLVLPPEESMVHGAIAISTAKKYLKILKQLSLILIKTNSGISSIW